MNYNQWSVLLWRWAVVEAVFVYYQITYTTFTSVTADCGKQTRINNPIHYITLHQTRNVHKQRTVQIFADVLINQIQFYFSIKTMVSQLPSTLLYHGCNKIHLSHTHPHKQTQKIPVTETSIVWVKFYCHSCFVVIAWCLSYNILKYGSGFSFWIWQIMIINI